MGLLRWTGPCCSLFLRILMLKYFKEVTPKLSLPRCRKHTLLFQLAEWYFRWNIQSLILSRSPFTRGPASVQLPCLSFEIIQPNLSLTFTSPFFFVMFCQQGPPSRRIVSFYTRYSPQRDLPSHWHNSCLSSLAAGLCELPLGKMPMAPHLLHYPNSSCCPDTSSYVLTNCRPLTEFSGITHLEMACDRQECHKTASAAPQSLWSLAV